jgi:uncharacterized protein (TIGR01777 family)
MRVLVTGGTGFIGRALCQQLVRAGHAPCVLTRDAGKAATKLPGVRLIEQLEQAGPMEAVVNLAGEPLAEGRWTTQRKQAFRDSRIGTTQRLLQWIEAQPVRPRVMVSGSAIGYYGARDDVPVNEEAPAGHDFAAHLCRDWEAEALRAQALGVRTCIVRIGIVLGKDGGALAKMLPPFKLGMGGPMGDGRQWMSWVHRQDVVRLILWLLESEHTLGIYNATAPSPLRNKDFAHTLGKVLDRPTVIATPAVALKLMFGEMSALLLTGQQVVPARAQAQGFVFEHPELEAALRDLLQ